MAAAVAISVTVGAARADAAALMLEWDPPSDSGLTVGYIVSYGTSSRSYTARVDVGYLHKFRVEGLADATTYCFVVQAYDARGELSKLSPEVCSKTATPPAPSGTPPPGDGMSAPPPPAAGSTANVTEIVLYASEARVVKGHWTPASSAGAAGTRAMRSADSGYASPHAPSASPSNFFEMRFEAKANTPYRLWLRLRAAANSKWNDSVWVQLSDALINGAPAYRIGSTRALAINLEACNACGTSGWGWSNAAYWLAQNTTVTFAESGTHTLRVQTREDGVEVDQVVLSAARYMFSAPGPSRNDSTVLPPLVPLPIARTPYSGTPIALPATIDAARFDQGSAGVAYGDTSPGNAGGSFRMTDVDLQPSSLGGYNIGWTEAGEWVTYTVDVRTAGAFTAQVRVASLNGGFLQITAGAPSNVAKTIAVPKTGAWQAWTTASVPVTLAAGRQTITVRFGTSGINLRSITVK